MTDLRSIGQSETMNVMPVHLDYNATTPLDPRMVEVMPPLLDTHFGNPSPDHVYGRAARVR